MLVVLFIFGWALSSPELGFAHLAPIPAGPPDLANGRRVFLAGDCASCHASPGAGPLRLGGGRPIRLHVGTFYPPNISPDREFGIGGWSLRQFQQAVQAGVDPEGRHLYPVFPYPFFRRMKPADLRDLFAYLRTLPPVRGAAPEHEIRFPFGFRRAIGLWKLFFMDRPPVPLGPGGNVRGAYLVESLAHCAECHSPRNIAHAIIADRRFTGTPDPEREGAWIPDITQDEYGLKAWSRPELVAFLSGSYWGSRQQASGDRMVDVVEDMSKLPRSDIEATADYILSLRAQRKAEPPAAGVPLTIRITARQGWWELRYLDAHPDRIFATANELHLPLGRPILLDFRSADGTPSGCRLDLASPAGQPLLLRTAGLFQAQAQSESCRPAPANMLVVAETEGDFGKWRAHQLGPAQTPQTDSARHGRALFLSRSCSMCHQVRGTPAFGTIGPDLTHLQSRHYIAAGALPTLHDTLEHWIACPECQKPGTAMPRVPLTPQQREAIVNYLQDLR